ncbi:MAG: spiro-SPASM protein [Treponema sp.]|nr:spiro-SPASM protein [Treponema sp.]
MKYLVILFAGFETPYFLEKSFDGKSAFDRSLDWACSIDSRVGITVLCTGKNEESVKKAAIESSVEVQIQSLEKWNCGQLVRIMSQCADRAGADGVLYSSADRPFLDLELAKEVLDCHEKYIAEYTFADGYPFGFAPEVIDCGTLRILSGFTGEHYADALESPVSNECIFNLLKKDINSFEIEAVTAKKDYRMLRLDFSCSVKRNFVACKNLYDLAIHEKIPFGAESLSDFAETRGEVQHTLPAYYSVQINSAYRGIPFYNVYAKELAKDGVMSLEKFKGLASQISACSDDAVIGFGSFGEPLLAENFCSYVEAILEYDNLSLLVETDGICVTQQLAQEVSSACKKFKDRKNHAPKISWIVSIDAFSENMYNSIFEGGNFAKAVEAVSILHKEFPGVVYPQFTRMNENECELEKFYRYWSSPDSPSGGKLIIQKYDNCCGKLPDRKPADLTPVDRYPCWHIKRDMTVMCDGSVPLCRQNFGQPLGNVFEEEIEKVWQKFLPVVKEHVDGNYCGKCGKCDEYYTFNF